MSPPYVSTAMRSLLATHSKRTQAGRATVNFPCPRRREPSGPSPCAAAKRYREKIVRRRCAERHQQHPSIPRLHAGGVATSTRALAPADARPREPPWLLDVMAPRFRTTCTSVPSRVITRRRSPATRCPRRTTWRRGPLFAERAPSSRPAPRRPTTRLVTHRA